MTAKMSPFQPGDEVRAIRETHYVRTTDPWWSQGFTVEECSPDPSVDGGWGLKLRELIKGQIHDKILENEGEDPTRHWLPASSFTSSASFKP
jgi:hypothetical protein